MQVVEHGDEALPLDGHGVGVRGHVDRDVRGVARAAVAERAGGVVEREGGDVEASALLGMGPVFVEVDGWMPKLQSGWFSVMPVAPKNSTSSRTIMLE